MQQKPTVGRIVHVVLKDGSHRPGIVINAFPDDRPNLSVFIDSTNDLKHGVLDGDDSGIFPDSSAAFVRIGAVAQLDSAPYDETGTTPGTWHWPERE